jgi:hypothetical protein
MGSRMENHHARSSAEGDTRTREGSSRRIGKGRTKEEKFLHNKNLDIATFMILEK